MCVALCAPITCLETHNARAACPENNNEKKNAAVTHQFQTAGVAPSSL